MQIILLYMVALCVAFCHCDQSVAKPLSDQRVVNKLVSNLFDMLTRDSQASSGTNMFGLSENNFQSLLAPEQLSAVDLDNLDKMTSFEYAPKSSSFDNMFNQPIEAPPAVQLTNSVDESALKTQDSAVDDIVRAIFGVNSESNLIAPEKFSASSQDTLSKLEPISNPSSSSSLENAFSQSVQVPTVVEPIGGQMAFDENVLKQDSLNDGGGYFGSLFGVSENGLKNVLASNELAGVDLDAFTAFQHVPKPSRLENAFSRIVDVPQAPPETITQFSSDSILDDPSLFAQDVQPSAAGGLFGNLFGLSENNLKNILASNELAGVDLDAFSAFQHVPKPSRLDKAFTQVVDAPVVVPKVELPSPVVQTWNQVHTIKEAAPAIQLHQPTLEPYREPTVELNKPVKTSKYYNGNELNQHVGGLCRDFFNNNTVNTCCSKRDDECYMIHYGTRCYCDIYCNRHHMENYNSNPYDCCPDAEQDFCSAKSATTTTPKPAYYPNYNYNNYQIPQKIPNKQRPIVVQYRPAPLYTTTTPEPIYTTTTPAAAVSSSVYTTTSTTERPAPIFRPAFRPLPPTTNTISPTTTTSAPTTTLTYPATTPDPIFLNGLFCKKQGVLYPNGFTLSENCKKCYCLDGVFKCVPKPCMVNTTLLNEINSQPSTWQASNQSEFWGQTLEYGYLHKLGVKLPNADFRNEKAYYANETEQSYDFRWEHFVRQPTSVWNQGECGASWAFSTVDVLVDRASKHEGKMIKVSPSVQMLISCTNKFTSNNCEPVEIDAGWAYIESYLPRSQGLVDEICYPLESATAGISNRCAIFEPDPNRCTDNKPYNRPYFKSTRAYRVRANTADIMHEILKNGPVQMVFKVYSDFFIYKSGIYIPTPNAYIPDVPNPYHAVKVLGWGTLNGVDYWIAANSWGPNWGENGFFKIKRQEPKTEIGQHVFAAWGFYDR